MNSFVNKDNMRAVIFLLLIVLFSCGLEDTKKKLENEDKKKRNEVIAMLNKEYMQSIKMGRPDEGKAASLLHNYLDYSVKYPDDSLAHDYLFKAAQLAISLRRFYEGVDYLKKYRSLYPNQKHAPMALFLLGFTYENNLADIAKAEKYYTEFLEQYPQHELAHDIQVMLDNLGKTPDQIIEEAQQKKDTIM